MLLTWPLVYFLNLLMLFMEWWMCGEVDRKDGGREQMTERERERERKKKTWQEMKRHRVHLLIFCLRYPATCQQLSEKGEERN